MPLIPPPDLVIFDVDGTLHAAALWWPQLIREGLLDFARATGLALDLPDDRAALAGLGEDDAGVWAPFLPPAAKQRWPEPRALVLPRELEVLRSGADYLFPGVRPLLRHLRRLGVELALASNCGADYMAAMLEGQGQGLGELTDWQFCLATGGVQTKADMLSLALECGGGGGRSAVMVGDRPTDQEAARVVGLPFIWRINESCRILEAEGTWGGKADEFLSALGLPRISSGAGE